MADISIRNLDPVIVAKLDYLAKKNKISREEYLRRYLSRIAEMDELVHLDEKYRNLVSVLADRMEQANDIIAENTLLLERLEKKLDAQESLESSEGRDTEYE
ncbi:hypothetical protein [uncultured Merdimonas sp.]|uniref:FitA-like ribbon-helix-helix domain-containing protein n=1 Tax=uncultured Merdimonas sp. TaxID=2023269 RepID=UPI00320B10A8